MRSVIPDMLALLCNERVDITWSFSRPVPSATLRRDKVSTMSLKTMIHRALTPAADTSVRPVELSNNVIERFQSLSSPQRHRVMCDGVDDVLSKFWSKSGDKISFAYSGTRALALSTNNVDGMVASCVCYVTGGRSSGILVAIGDAYSSARRMVQGAFHDESKQEAMDILLGHRAFNVVYVRYM